MLPMTVTCHGRRWTIYPEDGHWTAQTEAQWVQMWTDIALIRELEAIKTSQRSAVA